MRGNQGGIQIEDERRQSGRGQVRVALPSSSPDPRTQLTGRRGEPTIKDLRGCYSLLEGPEPQRISERGHPIQPCMGDQRLPSRRDGKGR